MWDGAADAEKLLFPFLDVRTQQHDRELVQQAVPLLLRHQGADAQALHQLALISLFPCIDSM